MTHDNETRQGAQRDNRRIYGVAFVSGAAAGAILALLFAPAKGSQTRKKVFDSVGATTSRLAVSTTNSLTTAGATIRVAQFQIERLFSSVTAGIEEMHKVKAEIKRNPEYL